MTLKPYCQEWAGNPAERKEKKTNGKISELNVRDQMDLAEQTSTEYSLTLQNIFKLINVLKTKISCLSQ